MKRHVLKCWPVFFDAILSGEKTFEYRLNDRGFETMDILCLREFDPIKQTYSGREITKQVGFLLHVKTYTHEGFVILSLLDWINEN